MRDSKIKALVYTSLMIALVCVATMSIRIPVPFTNGYIHAGDSVIFVAAIILGWKNGAIAAGVGSGLADLLGGYAHWVLPTLIIKAIMAAIVGYVMARDVKKKNGVFVLSGTIAIFWFGFNYVLKGIITKITTQAPDQLMDLVEGATETSQAIAIAEKLQSQLLISSLMIPLFLIGIAIYMKKSNKLTMNIFQMIGMTLAGMWMVFGYYIAGGLMYGNFTAAIFSIPWNIIQFLLGFVIALIILTGIMKTTMGKNIMKN